MQELNENYEIESKTPEDLEVYSPNNPPWSVGMAILLWISSVAFIFLLPVLFVVPYISSQGLDFENQELMTEYITSDWVAILVGLSSTILAHILTIILAWVIVTRFKTFSFRKMLGCEWGGFKIWHLVAIIVGVYVIAISLVSLLGAQEDELTKILQSSRAAVFLVAFLATFTAPLVEEVVYRGVLYSAFQKYFNAPAAVLIVTVLFAAVHVPQYLPNYATIITICILSLILTLIRWKTDNLLPCIILHTVFNGLQSILLILEPYLPLPETLKTQPEKAATLFYSLM